ncbi:MAG TPA: hypothetical protein VLJ61_18240 [Pyrinomonadaceae bacterium]|nr:hypothetical protein [Pyrinomonadaceae bacterium]
MNPAREVTLPLRERSGDVQSSRLRSDDARTKSEPRPRRRLTDAVWRLYPIALVSAFPVALMSNFWLEVLRGARSHATDGSGHWGVAQIYNSQVFPDTFGWTNAYFAGMPFPNFYPPLFHWLVGLLQAAHALSFEDAFKIVLVAPVLLMPAAVWLAARTVACGGDRAANAAACASVFLLADMSVQTSTCGLDYASTFVAGFYTQPLGFVLLLAWFAAYTSAQRSRSRAAASAVLLALTVLANFFNAFTAALLAASTLAFDLINLCAAKDARTRAESKRALVFHLATPLVALSLCLFWLVPVFGTYEYFVTRPLVVPLGNLVSPLLCAWYAVAAFGVVLWIRRSRTNARAYVLALFALAAGVVSASTIAPPWFPLQAFRFLSTLNLLLAVPVGVALSAALDFFKIEIKRPKTAARLARHVAVVFAALFAFGIFQATQPTGGMAFYTKEENARIESVLRFARGHRDGRYLVEVLDVNANPLHADSPALNAYLGAQGNETLGVVYREASPNSLFFNALANAISTGSDSFGISSVLADDEDFAAQSLARQLERARWLGVRYVLAETDATKERLAREPAVAARYDLDRWSVFELNGETVPRARVLQFRPALVVSDFSVKERRENEYDFTRLAEEQFNDGWFDVMLARAPERKIDRLTDLEEFGALVVDTYDCDEESRAYSLLREFAARRALVLLESDAPLFRRIASNLSEFPHAHVVSRTPNEPPGERVGSFQPSRHFDENSVRRVWRGVRAALESEEVASGAKDSSVGVQFGRNEISLTPGELKPDETRAAEDLPVLVSTTYSPDWRAREGNRIYAATPFFMLTFLKQPAHLVFARGPADVAGLLASGVSLLSLCVYTGAGLRRRRRGVEEFDRHGSMQTKERIAS